MFRPLTRRILAVCAFALAAVIAFSACGGSSSSATPVPSLKFPAFQRGNNIWIQVYGVALKDAVYYSEQGTTYVVKPKDPKNKLAVVDAQIGNDRSTTVIMNVDEKAYTLLDAAGTEHPSVNPFEQRELAATKPNSEPFYLLIWKNFNIDQGFSIRGAAIFEVPPDLKATQFHWEAVDTVFVRFTG
ncbi:MAG: hypothetical protein HY261_01050 [Chloroflexi bacterium]|nr:hypothetical protein [Chloroflexota bacterium]